MTNLLKNHTLMEEYIKNSLQRTHNLIKTLSNSKEYISLITDASKIIVNSISNGHCIYIAGNGGSAAQSQHFVAELVSRFNFDRNPLPAAAFTTDTSVLTAVANDYGYDKVFERQLAALAKPGDVFIGFTTSGASKNIINAFKKANQMNILSIGMCGKKGMKELKPNLEISVPSVNTPLIQEMHCITSHIICDIVEKAMFS